MNVDLSWPQDAFARGLIVTLVLGAIVIPLHHYVCGAGAGQARLRRRFGVEGAVFVWRLAGAVLFAVPTVGVTLIGGLGPEAIGLTLPSPGVAASFVAFVVVVVIPIIALSSRTPAFADNYPQIDDEEDWDARRIVKNALTWSVYLCGYELFFRGVLLGGLAQATTPWVALAITTMAYVWQHLPKNGSETAGTIPMGLLFGAVTLMGGGIWGPLVAHILIANASDLLAARARKHRRARQPAPIDVVSPS